MRPNRTVREIKETRRRRLKIAIICVLVLAAYSLVCTIEYNDCVRYGVCK